MSEITCNIIRDLLPSYMDKIASDDSVRLIETHLAACQECQDFKDRLEKPDFHVAHETDNLDYLKKIRRLADFKSAVCFLLLLITGASGKTVFSLCRHDAALQLSFVFPT